MIIEACVESFEEANMAQKNGAQQIELCSNLSLDGLTPDYELAKQCFDTLDLKTKVMIRPKAGNFITNIEVFQKMVKEIQNFNLIGIYDIVFGLTTEDQRLDIAKIKDLASIDKKNSITIHKAIDACADPLSEIHRLKEIENIDYILSSGKAQKCGDKIALIACGKITDQNLHTLDKSLQLNYYHGRKIVGNLST